MSPSITNPESKWAGTAKILAVLLVVCLGLWGCARQPAGKVSAERVRALEARCQKLEQDYRAVAAARDKARTDLRREQADRGGLLKEQEALRGQVKRASQDREEFRQLLAQRTGERDDLRQQMSMRLSERDALQGRCEKLRKGLQTLLSQDDQQPLGLAVPTVSPTGPAGGPLLGGSS